MNPSKIVVHGGPAHLDDVLAVALALGHYGMLPVERKDPTPAELDDPGVLVLDVGGRHEPDLLNFDHHQLRPENPEESRAAFALLAEHLVIESALSGNPWYLAVNWNDCLGPQKTAKLVGLYSYPRELVDPLGRAIVSMFAGAGAEPDEELLRVLERVGRRIIDESTRAAEFVPALRKRLERVKVRAVNGVILEGPPLEADWQVECLENEIDRMGKDADPIAFSVVPDQRGEGFGIYRKDDHPAVDLSKLSGDG